jgi:hypothetical protein
LEENGVVAQKRVDERRGLGIDCAGVRRNGTDCAGTRPFRLRSGRPRVVRDHPIGGLLDITFEGAVIHHGLPWAWRLAWRNWARVPLGGTQLVTRRLLHRP